MVHLNDARQFVAELTAQLTEARALIRALDSLRAVSGTIAETEALEARLREILSRFPGAPACIIPEAPAPAPVCVCASLTPLDCICGAIHPEGPALNLAEKARRGRLTARDVFES